MKASRVRKKSKDVMEMRWSPMVVVSVLFHMGIFSFFLFVPESIPSRPFAGVVYEVNLVEMPPGMGAKSKGISTSAEQKGKAKAVIKRKTRARRIEGIKKTKKPLIIAKRTVKEKTSSQKKRKVSSSQLIDRAISKIKRKVRSEKNDHINQAISKLESRAKDGSGSVGQGGRPGFGTHMQFYQAEVEEWIKSNWSYPVALQSQKNLEAIVLIMVKRDGTISKTRFEKKSSNSIFDQSVLKAIERSDPLPPFPESYRKSYDEIEINFNLKELENL